ncbi:hypothetical protein Tco_0099456 [Tanacetum coccineum]
MQHRHGFFDVLWFFDSPSSNDIVLMDDLLSNDVAEGWVLIERQVMLLMYIGLSAACTAEDFDTTGEFPLSNSLNIRLYSNSASFDAVITISNLKEHSLDFWTQGHKLSVSKYRLLNIEDRGQN